MGHDRFLRGGKVEDEQIVLLVEPDLVGRRAVVTEPARLAAVVVLPAAFFCRELITGGGAPYDARAEGMPAWLGRFGVVG